MRRVMLVAASLFAFSALAQTKDTPAPAGRHGDEFPQADKHYWLAPRASVRLCPKPMPDIMDRVQCPEMKPGKFAVTEVLLFNKLPAYYRIEGNGQAGYVRAEDRANFVEHDPQGPDAARTSCTTLGTPKLGMTAAEAAETCWGKPIAVKPVNQASQHRVQYVYGTGRYLYFENGVLIAIENPR
jgi:hypothetical protein